MNALAVIAEPALPVVFEAELELASDFAKASKSAATLKAYRTDFSIFEAWCRGRGLSGEISAAAARQDKPWLSSSRRVRGASGLMCRASGHTACSPGQARLFANLQQWKCHEISRTHR